LVKDLDDSDLASIEHIGIALWRAALAWRSRMRAEMARRGYPWHQSAAGEVLAHLGPEGISQAELTVRMGMSKQAVQQLVDRLEELGVVMRELDPADRRAKRLMLTQLGLHDFAERNRVKREIEAEYREKVGEKAFVTLKRALARLA
jgi:DNA-binding MarR family transcriptional regulator